MSAIFYSIQGLRQDNIYGPKTKAKLESTIEMKKGAIFL